jgi:hypothetical protein
MSGITDINELLSSMQPALVDELFVFCTVKGQLAEYVNLAPIATFIESEGVFQQITLTVHSSLEAVGLTAAIATKLTSKGISANVIAAYYHDHIFVSDDKAEQAISALKELSKI